MTCEQITLKTYANLQLDLALIMNLPTEWNIFASCQNELLGTLNEPLEYQEVFNVCSKLKSGVSGVVIDYEHIRFGGPILWKLLHDLHQVFFNKS